MSEQNFHIAGTVISEQELMAIVRQEIRKIIREKSFHSRLRTACRAFSRAMGWRA